MFKTLTDTSKAAIFTGLVLILAVAAALAINALGLASNELAWGTVWSITPVLATLIMPLVVTREGYSRKGWQSLGLHRLGLRMWPIAFFGTLAMMLRGDDKARHDATPPVLEPVTRPQRRFQAGLVMPQAGLGPWPALRRWKPRRQVPALLLLTVALCMVPTVPSYADPPAAGSPDFVAIDAYLDREMRELRIPGLALGIVHNDEIVHLQGFGVADASGRIVTPQTPFILASASKSFTALAIMQLVEEGKVDLDAPVVTYLPSFSVGDESASATITVRHLLNHTSGLPESTAFEPMLSNDMTDDALSERVAALSDAEVESRAGEVFEYTDANYDVLGLIVEKVSGQTYESRIRQRIFAPLRMSHSFTDQTDARRSGLATGHRSWFGFPRPFDAPYSRAAMPSSYLISSAEDVTHFLISQLNGGTYDAASVLSPEGIAAMHQPAVREGDRDIFYGMGWESRTLAGVPVVRHKGTNANFYADMVLNKEDRWGIVILDQPRFAQLQRGTPARAERRRAQPAQG